MVFVGDGRKALFLRNDGDEKFPNLKTEQVFADDNPPTHEQGTDRPGSDSLTPRAHPPQQRRDTDWHHLEEHRFVERVAAALRASRLRTSRRTRSVSDGSVASPPAYCADAATPRGRVPSKPRRRRLGGRVATSGRAPATARWAVAERHPAKRRRSETPSCFSASWPAE